jgi:ATP/maltotriose-dependent transcriptional regulator MalT
MSHRLPRASATWDHSLYRGEHIVGVFGQVTELIEEPHSHPDLHLTPRQAEVLELLETVRNHIRRLLQALGAHSRLEAVAIAHGAH